MCNRGGWTYERGNVSTERDVVVRHRTKGSNAIFFVDGKKILFEKWRTTEEEVDHEVYLTRGTQEK